MNKNPFQAQMNKLEAASIYGQEEIPRCGNPDCNKLLELKAGVYRKYCNKDCRKARTKRGRKHGRTKSRQDS